MNRRDYTDQIVICTSESGPDKDLTVKDMDNRDRHRGYFQCVHHFVVRKNGAIEFGPRDYTEPSMGLGRDNASSVSICVIGGKGEPPFTRDQIITLRAILDELQAEYPTAVVKHHHEINPRVHNHGLDLISLAKDITACP